MIAKLLMLDKHARHDDTWCMTSTSNEQVLRAPGQPGIALQRQAAKSGAKANVIYVHGATFGADLSLFYRFDGRSWADALNDAGFHAWGFDFAGYGHSDRYPADDGIPHGRVDEALPQLERAVAAVREQGEGLPIVLLAHSWGTIVAGAYAAIHPNDLMALVLFGPVAMRKPVAPPATAASNLPNYLLTTWAQYRRFVEDVPRGHPQVLSEEHFDAWSARYLASDPQASSRNPPSVLTPWGPKMDIAAAWSGEWLYDASAIKCPSLVVRGEWDSVSNDEDAATLIGALGTSMKEDVRIARATHLMHLESARVELYQRVNDFLQRVTH
jgi:alpha-beta hydrolase superfamily lysophospholipase